MRPKTASQEDDSSSDDEDLPSQKTMRKYDHLLAPIIVFWWSPIFALRPMLEAMTGGVATAVGAFSVGLGVFALQSRRTAAYLKAVPPVAKCFVSGLLSGLGLLVMVPSALDLKPPGYPTAHLLLSFCAAPVAMYVIHHVILEHQHHQPGSCGPHLIQVQQGKGPAKLLTGGTLKFNKADNNAEVYCVASSGRGKQQAAAKATGETSRRGAWEAERQRAREAAQWLLLEAGLTEEARERLASCSSVMLRAVPYALHASIDGAVLATATSLRMLASLALPITLCAVQDIGTLLVALTACKVSRRATLAITGCFGLGFPLGASLALAMGGAVSGRSAVSARGAATSLSSDASSDVALVRAFAGGLFLYM